MITPELLQHIRDQTKRGMPRVFISQELLRNGWTVADINEGFNATGGFIAPTEKVVRGKGYAGMMITTLVVILVLGGGGYWAVTHLSSLPFLQPPATYTIIPSVAGNAFAPVPEYQSSGYSVGGVTYGTGVTKHTTSTYATYIPNPTTNTSVAVAYIPPTIPNIQTSVTTVPIISGGGGGGGGGNGGNPPPPPALPRLSVSGSQILDQNGNPITLRGFNWGWWGTPEQQDAADNITQGANYVRIPLSWYFGSGTGATDCKTGQDSYDLASPETGYINPANLAIVDQEVSWASSAHLWVDLMVRGGDCDFWTNPTTIPQYLLMWQFLANRYKNTPYIGSYEVLSEPHPAKNPDGSENNTEVKGLLEQVVTAVHAIDPVTPIVVGPAKDYNLRNLEQIYMPDQSNLIYAFNFFDLAPYVKSQGAQTAGYPGNYSDKGDDTSYCTYPGKGQTVYMDKTWLGGLLGCATAFRSAHNVPVYADQVGIWTETQDASKYVSDVLSLFNADGFNWTYWTYRSGSPKNLGNDQAMLYKDANGVWQTKTDWLNLLSSFFAGANNGQGGGGGNELNKVVPGASGVLLGIHVYPGDGNAPSEGWVTDFEQAIGRSLAIDSEYWNWVSLGDSDDQARVQWNTQNGLLTMESWRPLLTKNKDQAKDTCASGADILSGKYDAQIKQQADTLKGYGVTILLRWNYEMTDNEFNYCFNGGVKVMPSNYVQSGALYVSVWKHIHDIFTTEGATNVQWVWAPAASLFSKGGQVDSTDWQYFYPGSSYVDWIANDHYNKTDTPESYATDPEIANFYSQVSGLGKPLMQSETGANSDPAQNPDPQTEWLTTMFTAMQTQYPAFRALVYWDSGERVSGDQENADNNPDDNADVILTGSNNLGNGGGGDQCGPGGEGKHGGCGYTIVGAGLAAFASLAAAAPFNVIADLQAQVPNQSRVQAQAQVTVGSIITKSIQAITAGVKKAVSATHP